MCASILLLGGCARSAATVASSTPAPAARPVVQEPHSAAARLPAALGVAHVPLVAATPGLGAERERAGDIAVPRHATVAYAPRAVRPVATPFGILRPHDPPQIYVLSISPTDAGAGETVSGTVSTSSNVASVVATVAGISAAVPKVGVGQFAMSYRLPAIIPPFTKGTYAIVVVARNVDGTSTSRSVAITLH